MPKKKGWFSKLLVEADKEIETFSKYKTKGWVCNSCGYQWLSKKDFGDPAKCPKCNSLNIRRVNAKFRLLYWKFE